MKKQQTFNFIDLFSGAGGLSKGMEMAGWNCLLGVDFNEDAIKSFELNHKNAKGFCGDISSLTHSKIKKITGIKEPGKISEIITNLNEFYLLHNRAYSIQKVAGGYQLRTSPRFRKWIRKGRIVKPIHYRLPPWKH